MMKETRDFLAELKDGFPSFQGPGDVTEHTRAGETGDYPIHYAAIQNRKLVVEQMLELGVDVNVTGEDDCTALDYALLHGHEDLAEYLRTKGGRANRV